MTKFLVDLYASNRPHLVDSITVEAETLEEAARAASQDSRVESGVLYAHNAKRLPEPGERENLTLSTEEAWALPRPADESYQVGQRIICVNLSHIGATVRSLDDTGVGLDYGNDDEEDKEFGYEALYSHIRPMPFH